MSRTFLDVLILTAVYLSWFNEMGSAALTIDINPSKVNALVHNDVIFHCNLDSTDNHVKEIVLLELSKNDVPIAVLRQNAKLSIADALKSKFSANGTLSDPVYDSYIHVTLAYPEEQDSGMYTCLMYFLDYNNVLKEARRSNNLTVSDQDMKSALIYLVDKVSSLQTELNVQRSDHKSKVDQLLSQMDRQKNDLQGNIDTLEREIETLQEKDNTTVLFKAIHTRTGSFPVGGTLMYGDVIDNVGGGYSGQTGVFTAPVSGYYLIHVSVATQATKYILLDLMTSNGKRLTKLLAGDNVWESYADTSCVVKLDAGHQVWPVIGRVDPTFHVHGEVSQDPMSKFYGYLLKKL